MKCLEASSFVAFLHVAAAIIGPCRDLPLGPRNQRDGCQWDEDCEGSLSICRKGRCHCIMRYDAALVSQEEQRRACTPAPSAFDLSCEENCDPPLVCSNKKCICPSGKPSAGTCDLGCASGERAFGFKCHKQSGLGGACSSTEDCKDALTECRGGRCQCQSGTGLSGNLCMPRCPDGSSPRKVCRKQFEGFPEMLTYRDSSDNCGSGAYCATVGKPSIGVCCPLRCPVGYPSGKSCEVGDRPEQTCNLDTHYCFVRESPNQKNALCCPKACKGDSIYHSGQCYPRSDLGGSCQLNEQCDGGVTMSCSRGKCVCRPGFSATYTTKLPTCIRTCGGNRAACGSECLAKLATPYSSCTCSAQCPRPTFCNQGRCACPCTMELRGEKCVSVNAPKSPNEALEKISSFLTGGQTS